MKRASRASFHNATDDDVVPSRGQSRPGSQSAKSLGSRAGSSSSAHYSVPATASRSELLNRGSDRQFRGLVQDLLTVSRRLETARDYFGSQVNISGSQYHLLMTVAQLQGATGVSVRSVAHAMHVSSAFVASETGKLVVMGLLRKRPNPQDRRSALMSLTQAGRLKIDRLIETIRVVNDLFFGRLDADAFAALCAGAGALVQGSREAMRFIEQAEENLYE